ncbi:MAG TPA: hypothetical protein VMI11_11220 [Actinomycetes bacterium]|nr:hypothetical protein [Actinomycetes bacterium]
MTTSTGPVSAVLDAFGLGVRTLDEVCRCTGLPRDVVDAAVEYLVRSQRLRAEQLTSGCPSGGCGSCASGSAGSPGCGATASSAERTGPVLVALSLRR